MHALGTYSSKNERAIQKLERSHGRICARNESGGGWKAQNEIGASVPAAMASRQDQAHQGALGRMFAHSLITVFEGMRGSILEWFL